MPRAFVPSPAEPARNVAAADRGVMCATTDRQVALAFSGGRAAHASVLEIGFDYSSHGASLHWLSQYPAECEVAYLPCTTLTPQGVRQWSERRRVISVHATLTSMRVRTDAITTLDTDPSGAVHAIASAVTSGVQGLSASLGVGKLWNGSVPAASEGAASLAHRDSRASVGAQRASGAQMISAAPTCAPALAPSSAAVEVVATGPGSPLSPQQAAALQQELSGELKYMRSRRTSGTREQVIATRGAGSSRAGQAVVVVAATAAGGGDGSAADGEGERTDRAPIAPFSFGESGGAEPTPLQRKAVLTINDALQLLDEIDKPKPPKPPSAAELRVHKRLEAATGHLSHAAQLEDGPHLRVALPASKTVPIAKPLSV